MRAYVSYSFQDSELYIVTLLFTELRKRGYVVDTYDFSSGNYDDAANYKIQNSNVFIGIITNDSTSIDEVFDEWEIANANGIPHVLIIENDVHITDPSTLKYVRFDRNKPKAAVDRLFEYGSKSKQSANPDVGKGLAALGVIGALAAIIVLLSRKD